MTITITTVGKKIDEQLLGAIDMYQKRLSGFSQIKWDFIPPSNITDVKQKIAKEGDVILSKINSKSYVVLLDENGQMLNNQQLASALHARQIDGDSAFTFIIGGSHGVSESVKQASKMIWSLSPLAFPHQLVRLILIEQLYRTTTILQNHPYHH